VIFTDSTQSKQIGTVLVCRTYTCPLPQSVSAGWIDEVCWADDIDGFALLSQN